MVGLAAYGVGLGIVDATGNMQAVALEHRLGRAVLPSCHGAWTLGGVIAAVLTLATVDLPWSATALVAVLPLLVAFAPYLARDHGVAATTTETDVPWRAIMLVGLALVSSTSSTRPPRPGDRSTSTTSSRPPRTSSRWPRCPISWPAVWCGWSATG